MSSPGVYKNGCITFTAVTYVDVADPLGTGLAIFFGLLIGAAIAILIFYFHARRIFGYKFYDTNKMGKLLLCSQATSTFTSHITLMQCRKRKKDTTEDESSLYNSRQMDSTDMSPIKPVEKVRKEKKRDMTSNEVSNVYALLHILELDDANKGLLKDRKPMIDAIMQTTMESGEAVLSDHDLKSVEDVEHSNRVYRLLAMGTLEQIRANGLLSGGRLDGTSHTKLLKGIEDGIQWARDELDRKRKGVEEEIRSDPELAKKPEEMDKKLQDLPFRVNSILNDLLTHEENRFKKSLIVDGGLSEDNANAVLTLLAKDLANYEANLAQEQTNQLHFLEERLARRRQQLAALKTDEQTQKEEIGAKISSASNALSSMQPALSAKQKDDLLKAYLEQLKAAQNMHEANLKDQRRALAEKLAKSRAQKKIELEEKHIRDLNVLFTAQEDKNVKSEVFLKQLHKLTEDQSAEKDELVELLDTEECKEMDLLNKEVNVTRGTTMENVEDSFFERLKEKGNFSSEDVDKIMSLHAKQMHDWQIFQREERRSQQMKLADRLAAQQAEKRDSERSALQERCALAEQQNSVVMKTLNTQVEMADDAKKRIMAQHASNVAVLCNQTQINRARQEKLLEARLAKKRAEISLLKQKRDDVTLDAQVEKTKQTEQTTSKLNASILAAEDGLKKEKKTGLEALRETLAKETQESLDLQEKQIGVLIGQLQVGQARRQKVLAKQETLLKELESRMEKEMSNSNRKGSISGLDQILQYHHNNVVSLSEQQQQTRTNQEKAIEEKLGRTKAQRERELDHKLEDEAEATIDKFKNNGASSAVQTVLESSLQRNHKRAMDELELEFQVELQRQKDEMIRELQQDFEEELQDQRRSFLAQLANVSQLSKKDIDSLVASTAVESGMDEKAAKSLSRDFNKEVNRFRGNAEAPVDSQAKKKKKKQKAQDDFSDPEVEDETRLSSQQLPSILPQKKPRQKSATRAPAYGMIEEVDEF